MKAGESQIAYDEASPEVAAAGTTEAVRQARAGRRHRPGWSWSGLRLHLRGRQRRHPGVAGHRQRRHHHDRRRRHLLLQRGRPGCCSPGDPAHGAGHAVGRARQRHQRQRQRRWRTLVRTTRRSCSRPPVRPLARSSRSRRTTTPSVLVRPRTSRSRWTATPTPSACSRWATPTVTLTVDEGFFTNEAGTTNLGKSSRRSVTDEHRCCNRRHRHRSQRGLRRQRRRDLHGHGDVRRRLGHRGLRWTTDGTTEGTVDLVFSDDQTVGVLPKAPFETEVVYFDVFTYDKFGNAVDDVAVTLEGDFLDDYDRRLGPAEQRRRLRLPELGRFRGATRSPGPTRSTTPPRRRTPTPRTPSRSTGTPSTWQAPR